MSDLVSIDLSPAGLEAITAGLLKSGLADRGLAVRHNGTASAHAPGGGPDIDVYNDDVHIIVEVTKLRGAAQSNSEATPVAAHLDKVAVNNPGKQTFALFVSPRSFDRTINLFHHYNSTYAAQPDRKIAFMDFTAFNLFVEWLADNDLAGFTVAKFLEFLAKASDMVDDAAMLELLNSECLESEELATEVAKLQSRKLSDKYSELDGLFKGIHDDLRSVAGLGPAEAFHELSKLIFLKMYEEQVVASEEQAGRIAINRFSTEYIEAERRLRRGSAIHPTISLFEDVRSQFSDEGLFGADESIAIQPDKDRGNYIDDIVRKTEDYSFIDPDLPAIDIKGMIYEQFLGLSLKNTDLGQYFTPEAIVDFMVQLADPSPQDRVLDPACGTGRFLVRAMHRMLDGAESDAQRESIKSNQLHGGELSPSLAKIAKMNMFVHGDGRTNIRERDSLKYFPEDEERFDLILTNPPLGDINFKKAVGEYADDPDWYEAMAVVEVARRTLRSGEERASVSRATLKGGALFLAKFAHFLRPGGRVLTVIDESILNVDEYSRVRDFIRENFYVDAVFSLTDDAFKRTSKTATKTSILDLTLKENTTDVQTHPIFFGHAFQVGMNPKGKNVPNDLADETRTDDLLRAYRRFQNAVRSNKLDNEGTFDAGSFDLPPGVIAGARTDGFSQISYFCVPWDQMQDRLEYKWYDPTFLNVIARMEDAATVSLGDLVMDEEWKYGLTASGLEYGDIPFINIENLRPDASIDLRGVRYILDSNPDLTASHRCSHGDILISRSRLPGIAAVVGADQGGYTFGSYIIRARLSDAAREDYLPEYVALFVNSVIGQAQVHRLKSGSNGFNINTGQLQAIRILDLDTASQRLLADRAYEHQRAAEQLGALLSQSLIAAQQDFLAGCLEGPESVADPEVIVQLLKDTADKVELARTEVVEDAEMRELFAIRPTLYGRIPGSG